MGTPKYFDRFVEEMTYFLILPSAIFLATAIIVLVFAPLFFLSGVEGRFFRPLASAYVISLVASLAVAVTVTTGASKKKAVRDGALPRTVIASAS